MGAQRMYMSGVGTLFGSRPPFGMTLRNRTTRQMSSTRSRVPKFSMAVPWMPRSTRKYRSPGRGVVAARRVVRPP